MFGGFNNVVINVSGNVSNAVAGVMSVVNSMNQLATSSNTANTAINSLTGRVTTLVGAFGAYRIIGAVTQELRNFVHVAADFQKLEYSMTRFMNTSRNFNETLGWIDKLGEGTVGIRNMERAFMQLEHFGVNPTKQELEGLIGYFYSVGKVGDRELAGLVDKIGQLYSLGNIGMDDALKELTEYIPFLMQATKEKLSMSYSDILMEFKKKNLDFATLIAAAFEYSARNFRGGIADTAEQWDRLLGRLKNKLELFNQELFKSGGLRAMSEVVSGYVQQFDKLSESGKLREWATEVAGSIERVINALGLGGLDVETIGNNVVNFIKRMEDAVPIIRTIAEALGTLGKAMIGLMGIFNSLPSEVKSAVSVGLIGKWLFGNEIGMVMGGLNLAMSVAGKLETSSQAQGTLPGAEMNDLWQMMAPPESTMDGPIRSVEKLQKTVEETYGPRMQSEVSMGTSNMRVSTTQASEGMVVSWQNAGQALMSYINTTDLATVATNRLISTVKRGQADMAGFPYDQSFIQSFMAADKVASTMEHDAVMAGKTGVERQILLSKEKYLQFYEHVAKAKAALDKKFVMVMQEGGNIDEVMKEYAGITRREVEAAHALDNAIKGYKEGEAAKLAKKKGPAGPTIIDEEDMRVTIDRFSKMVANVSRDLQDVLYRGAEEMAKNSGDVLKAQFASIDRETEHAKANAIQKAKDLETAYAAMVHKLSHGKKLATDEAKAAVDAEKAKLDQALSMLSKMGAELDRNAAMRKERIEAISKADDKSELAQVASEHAKILGSMQQQMQAEAALVVAQGERQALTARTAEAAKMILEYTKAQAAVMSARAGDDFWAGMRAGYEEMRRTMAPLGEQGYQVFQKLKESIDSAAGAMADFTMKGKIDFQSMSDSIIRSILQIYYKSLLLKAVDMMGGSSGGGGLMSIFGSLFGGGKPGPSAFAGAVAHGSITMMAGGGLITEPIFGVGASGQKYLLGEAGKERVVPEGSSVGRPIQVTNHFVIQGNVNRSSQGQIANAAGLGLQHAMRRYN